jgi:hypothetical protein
MKLGSISVKKALIYFAAYEVAAYAFNSWMVSRPSVVGQKVFTLPFDFISNFVGYANPSNPTMVTPQVNGLGAYMKPPGLGSSGGSNRGLVR